MGLCRGPIFTAFAVGIELGRPGGAQAIANVLRTVPGLPWWRVLPSDGRLYCSHAPTQVPLLEAEGHRIDEHRRVHPG